MIIVIADDITGAAELAGIGLRYGLRVKLSCNAEQHDQTDLLVVYSNTRSLQKEEAMNEMKRLTAEAIKLNPSLIYKKTDSVLRGHVLRELEVQMEAIGVDKALLVPANPGLGRIIEGGLYYINGKPLHETNFSVDPEFPVKTSVVKELLTGGEVPVSMVRPGESLKTGVNVGETRSADDMKQWTEYQNDSLLLAGGGFFFDVLLSNKSTRKEIKGDGKTNYPVLFVIGTAFQKEERLSELNQVLSFMPEELFSDKRVDEKAVDDWSNEIVSLIKKYKIAFIAIGSKSKGNSELLREKMAQVVKAVVEKTKLREMIIEGGSTAFSIVNELNWKMFTPVEELAYGVVKMKVEHADNLFLTIKPGSYPWPSTWDFK